MRDTAVETAGSAEVFTVLDGDTGITALEARRSEAIEVHRSAALHFSISGMRTKSLSEAQLAERDQNHGDRPRLISLAASCRSHPLSSIHQSI